ncbi:MAG: hypothetical protein A3J40_01910 [Erythrobacter sp. RIFCSPHIGHO2_12_FULL_63_10]|nr:MAG: hypothetical protein A3J40_01910 [Erythrobacter sp. RIFCSPHIGHO2_12_FULL_63_10]
MTMGTALVAIVAILAWAAIRIVRYNTSHHRNVAGQSDAPPQNSDDRREIEDLRERIKVLERIATDGNSLDAQQTKQIAAEIEALRDRQDQ